MPKISGVFENFDDLDLIPLDNIYKWLKLTLPKNSQIPSIEVMENFIANKILYPQTTTVAPIDQAISLSILREALRRNPRPFLDVTHRRIVIPDSFLGVAANIPQLVYVFVDAFLLNSGFNGVWIVLLSGEQQETLGSIILPEFESPNSSLEIFLEGKQATVKKGQVALMPCPKLQCMVGFKSLTQAQISGKNEGVVPAYGGKLGVLVDGRRI